MKEKDDLSKRAGMKRTGAQGRKGLMEGAFQGRKHRGTIEDDGGREKKMHDLRNDCAGGPGKGAGTCSPN